MHREQLYAVQNGQGDADRKHAQALVYSTSSDLQKLAGLHCQRLTDNPHKAALREEFKYLLPQTPYSLMSIPY